MDSLSKTALYNAKSSPDEIETVLGKTVAIQAISFYNKDVTVNGQLREDAEIAALETVDKETGEVRVVTSPSPTLVACAHDIAEMFESGILAQIIERKPSDPKKKAFYSIKLVEA